MADKGLTMQGIIAMAIGVLSLVVVYIVVPLVGFQMDTAIALPAGNATSGVCTAAGTLGCQWNSSVNSNIPTAVGMWTAVAGIIKVGAILVIIGGFLRTLQGLRN